MNFISTGFLVIVNITSLAQVKDRKIIDVHLHAQHFNAYGHLPAPNPITGNAPDWKNDFIPSLDYPDPENRPLPDTAAFIDLYKRSGGTLES